MTRNDRVGLALMALLTTRRDRPLPPRPPNQPPKGAPVTRRAPNSVRDNTRNERLYLVTYMRPGFPRPLEFTTRDRRQARSQTRRFAAFGWHVKLRQHNGVGRWEQLEEHNAPTEEAAS